jgi:DNA-directed RNA polymerase subunit M/transcription elongation factor TFIIS
MAFQFPNAMVIPTSIYENPEYNRLRIAKLILISDSLGNKEFFDKNDKLNITHKYRKKKIIAKYLASFKNTNDILGYIFEHIKTRENITLQIESSCYNKTIKLANKNNITVDWACVLFVNIYNIICYKIASNIDPNSIVNSNFILDKIINDNIDLDNIASMPSRTLCPERYIEIDEKINKRNNLEIKIKFSELYKCKRCKKNQTTTERRYARSLDEGVDLTITCHFCGNKWNA